MKRYIDHFIKTSEKSVDLFLKNQVKDSTRRDYGGMEFPYLDVKPTVYVLTTAVALYLNEKSKFYYDEKLYKSMIKAIDYIASFQRPEGYYDFPSCNFLSAPDTAFIFKRLIAAYRLIEKYDTKGQADDLKEKYYDIMEKALNGIYLGGFHTPNHRWAICAALTQGANLIDDKEKSEAYLQRAAEYLGEGIDGNEDGEYAERSTGNYNAVVNYALMAMYEETQDEEYLGYVERNLLMMLTYFDPDDTIFTQNSTRQDQGRADYPDQYFFQYLYMANFNKNSKFDKAAHKIIKDNLDRGDDALDCLHFLMLNPELLDYNFEGYGFLDAYNKYYKDAGVVRAKTAKYGYTIMRDSATFLFMKVNDTQIYFKIGQSYCDVRNFVPQTIDIGEGEYTMTSLVKGWYYLPFKDYSGTSDWWQMDHSKREILENSEVRLTVKVKELDDGLEVTIKSEGLDGLPLRFEICIPSGSILENEHFYIEAEKGSGMILRDGFVNIKHNQNKIQIGPGFGTHEFRGHYSGEEKNTEGYTINMNDYTPGEKKIYFKVID